MRNEETGIEALFRKDVIFFDWRSQVTNGISIDRGSFLRAGHIKDRGITYEKKNRTKRWY